MTRGCDTSALYREDTLLRIKHLESEANNCAKRMNEIIREGNPPRACDRWGDPPLGTFGLKSYTRSILVFSVSFDGTFGLVFLVLTRRRRA